MEDKKNWMGQTVQSLFWIIIGVFTVLMFTAYGFLSDRGKVITVGIDLMVVIAVFIHLSRSRKEGSGYIKKILGGAIIHKPEGFMSMTG